MNNKYKLNVNKTFEVNLSEEDVQQLNAVKTSEDSYHVLNDNKSYQTVVTQSDFLQKKYTVKVNSTEYEVTIADELDQLIKEMGFSVGSSKHVNSIKAPMPGLILDIHVKAGDSVKEDDALLILEAMKMENVIVSPRDGLIKSVSVTKGAAIDKGQLLIEFE
ncbi:MAG: biotin/lipoyl-binding protein [Flavobacteriaceae bacterium]|nr:biotin/lipoyl-binding protein [Flavobacteriaceae bacterium]